MPHHYRVWADEPSASSWPDQSHEPRPYYSHTIRERALRNGNTLRLSFNTSIGNASRLTLYSGKVKNKLTLDQIFDNSLRHNHINYFDCETLVDWENELRDNGGFSRFYNSLRLWQLASHLMAIEQQDDNNTHWSVLMSRTKEMAHMLGIRSIAPHNDIRTARQLIRRLHFEWYFLDRAKYDGNLSRDVILSKILPNEVFYALVTSLPGDSNIKDSTGKKYVLNADRIGDKAAEYWRYYTGAALFGPVCLFLEPIYTCKSTSKFVSNFPDYTDDCCNCTIRSKAADTNSSPEVDDDCKAEYISLLERNGKLRFNWYNSLLDRGASAKFVSSGHKVRVNKEYFDRHNVKLGSLRQSVVTKNRHWILEGDDENDAHARSPSDKENSNLMRISSSEEDIVTSASKWRVDEYDYMESVCSGKLLPTKAPSNAHATIVPAYDYLDACSVAMPSISDALIFNDFRRAAEFMSEEKQKARKYTADGYAQPKLTSVVISQKDWAQKKNNKQNFHGFTMPIGFFALVNVLELMRHLSELLSQNLNGSFGSSKSHQSIGEFEWVKHQSHNIPLDFSDGCTVPVVSDSTLVFRKSKA